MKRISTRLYRARSVGPAAAKAAKRHQRLADHLAIVQDLAPPLDPDEDGKPADNLILTSAYDEDKVKVHVTRVNDWPGGPLYGDDSILLIVENHRYEVRLTEDASGVLSPDPVVFAIPQEHLGFGDYRSMKMRYEVAYYGGGSDPGPEQLISVDNIEPASGHDFARLEFDSRVELLGILPESFVTQPSGQYLPALVAGYEGLKRGDIIRGYINGVVDPYEADIGRVEDENAQSIDVHFSRVFIEDFPAGTLRFQCRVEAREGLQSNLSRPADINNLLGEVISDLEAPLIPAYADDPDYQLIDEADARNLVIHIPPHEQLTDRHAIQIRWGGTVSTPVNIKDPDDIQIAISYKAIADEWQSNNPTGDDLAITTQVSYDVLLGLATVGASHLASVVVNLHAAGGMDPNPGTGDNENLVAPVLISGNGDIDEIPLPAASKTATIRIPKTWGESQPVFVVGDKVTIHYGALALPEHTITEEDLEDLTEPLTANLSRGNISNGGSGTKVVAYAIERTLAAGGSNVSRSIPKHVRVVTRDVLPGGEDGLEDPTVPEAEDVDTPGLIGRPRLLDGTPVAMPVYKNFSKTDIITVYAGIYPRNVADPDNPVPGFGPVEGENLFVLSPDEVEALEAEPGERTVEPGLDPEGKELTRPAIKFPHILFRLRPTAFPGLVDGQIKDEYRMKLSYEAANEHGAATGPTQVIRVSTRGTLVPIASEPPAASHSLKDSRQLTRLRATLRDLVRLIERLLG